MPRLQSHFASSGNRNPLTRLFAGLVILLMTIIIIAITVIVALIAIPLMVLAWIVLSFRRKWTVRRYDLPDSRVNVCVRKLPH